MKIAGDKITFSTGREVYANNGIIGICHRLTVTEGYDGGFPAWPAYEDDNTLTKQERQELADHMIALWQKFREAEGPEE